MAKSAGSSPTPAPEITRKPISWLRPAPWNPRAISDERMANLRRSLAADPEFLELRPILALPDGTIIGGNQRWQAAKDLGWLEVPVIVQDMDEATAKARTIRDNEQWAEWVPEDLTDVLRELQATEQIDIEALGLTGDELRGMLDPEPTRVHPMQSEKPPRLGWALVGIPLDRWHLIAETLAVLAVQEGVTVETTIQ